MEVPRGEQLSEGRLLGTTEFRRTQRPRPNLLFWETIDEKKGKHTKSGVEEVAKWKAAEPTKASCPRLRGSRGVNSPGKENTTTGSSSELAQKETLPKKKKTE